jgi:hypothetical protein
VSATAGGARRQVLVPGAVLRGAAVAVAVCLPLALAGEAVADGDASALTAPLFLAVLVGLAAGGFVAARLAATAPYSNGGLAAVVAFVAIQGTALVVRAVAGGGDGDGPEVAGVVFNGLLAYGCGVAGGALASRRRGGDR